MEDFQAENQQNQNIDNFHQPQLKQKKQIPSWLGFVIIIAFAVLAFGGSLGVQWYLANNLEFKNYDGITKEFFDKETGIYFKYPEEWGDVRVENKFFLANILREISFTEELNIKLIANSGYLYHAEAVAKGIPYVAVEDDILGINNTRKFCDNDLSKTYFENRGNIFDINGSYYFTNCNENYVYIAEKGGEHDGGWVPVTDTREYTPAETTLSKSIFVLLLNQVYRVVTIKVNIPVPDSSDPCIYNGRKRLSSCMTIRDKESIDYVIGQFEQSDFSNKINYLVSSIKTFSGDEHLNVYKDYFEEKSIYENNDWGIKFDYPSIFGSPMVKDNQRLVFAIDGKKSYWIFDLQKRSYNDAVKKQADYQECLTTGRAAGVMGCGLAPQTPTEFLSYFNYIKDILSKNNFEESACKKNRCDSCEVVNFGGKKIIFKNGCFSPGGPMDVKIFIANNNLFAFYIPVKLDVKNFNEYQKIYYGIFKDILESMTSIGVSNSDLVKTYKNDEYGLEFKYPDDWEVNESKISEQARDELKLTLWAGFRPTDKTYYFEGGEESPIILTVYDKPLEVNAENKKNVDINGLSFVETETFSTYYSHSFYLDLSRGDKKSFLILSNNFNEPELEAVLSRMLSTFKFIK